MGAAFAPNAGGFADELVTVLPTVAFTKHPSIFWEVLSFSKNTSANPSISMLLSPFTLAKSTAGTITRHGSPAGMFVGFPPSEHGSGETVGQLFVRVSKAFFTGPELALLPGAVLTTHVLLGTEHEPSALATEYVPLAPFVMSPPTVEEPVPPSPSQSQLPSAGQDPTPGVQFMIEVTNLTPKSTFSPPRVDRLLQPVLH